MNCFCWNIIALRYLNMEQNEFDYGSIGTQTGTLEIPSHRTVSRAHPSSLQLTCPLHEQPA